jgi:hypothetical protein
MDIATLAALAGNAVVTAAATDAWEDVRRKVARLFGRGEADPTIERRLDDSWRQLTAARSTGVLDRAQADLARDWSVRLKDLLADYPDAEAELVALVENIGPAVVAAADHSIASAGDTNVKADHAGVAAGIVHGNVITPGPTIPGPEGG